MLAGGKVRQGGGGGRQGEPFSPMEEGQSERTAIEPRQRGAFGESTTGKGFSRAAPRLRHGIKSPGGE